MTYIALIVSVLLGASLVLFFRLKDTMVKLLLSFSGAYLLSVTVLHLLPEVYQDHNKFIGLYILLGIVIQLFLEVFSKGAEHGHIHNDMIKSAFPWLLFISLSIHAFSEGVPLSNTADHMLLWAVIIHKIPISIVLTTFLLHSNLSKFKVFLFVLLFALMSPLGNLVSDLIPFFQINRIPITAVIVGIFLHVASIILFESSEDHKFNYKKFMAIFLGFVIAMLSL